MKGRQSLVRHSKVQKWFPVLPTAITRAPMASRIDDARRALDDIERSIADAHASHEGALAALAARSAAAEAAAAAAAADAAAAATRLDNDAAARRALLAAAEEARAGMEAELWCIAAALEEKQRCVREGGCPCAKKETRPHPLPRSAPPG